MPVTNIDVKDALGVTRNINTIPNPGQATMANSQPVAMASDQPAITTKIAANATAAAAGLFAGVTGYGSLRVSPESVTLFTDPFDGGVIDTTNRWTNTGAACSQGSGVLTIAPGLVASAFGALQSLPTFAPPGLTFLGFGCALKLEITAITTQTHRFWGRGTANANTTAAPLSDAVGFEIATDGNLYGVVYAAGVRTATAAMAGKPVDGAFHKYIVVARADSVLFYIDDTNTPVAALSFVQPNVQTLPVRIHCINDPTPPGVAPVFQLSALGLNDTGRNSIQLSDGIFPHRKVTVSAAGALLVSSPGIPTSLGTQAAAASQPVTLAVETASGAITTQNLVPAGVATAGSAVEITLNGCMTVAVQTTGTYTGPLSLQVTADNTNWITVGGTPFENLSTGTFLATITSALQSVFQVGVGGFLKARITGLAAMTGTATVTLRAVANPTVISLGSAIPAGAAIIGALTANQSVNAAQINGVAPLMGNGVTGTGSLRFTLASDTTANSNPFLVTKVASAAQGAATSHHAISAATTNATSVKASAGCINSLQVSNINAAARFLKLYNKASAPTVGTDTPVLTILIPANANVMVDCGPYGIRFSTGIAYALTTGITVADVGAVAVSEHSVGIFYT